MINPDIVTIAGVLFGVIFITLIGYQGKLAKLAAAGQPAVTFNLAYVLSAVIAAMATFLSVLFVLQMMPEPEGIVGWVGLFLFGFTYGCMVNVIVNKPVDTWIAKAKALGGIEDVVDVVDPAAPAATEAKTLTAEESATGTETVKLQ